MTGTIIMGLLALTTAGTDPDTLRLSDALEAARANFPPARQADIQSEITDRRIADINARLRPQLSTRVQAVYHSEVPELPFDIAGLTTPEMSKDQYQAGVNVEQLIYDGGAASVQRAVERTSGSLAAKKVAVSLHERLERVGELYFAVLLQEAAAATLEVHRGNLTARRSAVEAQIDEGLLSANEADRLTAEILKIEQEIAEARANRVAALRALNELSGLSVEATATLLVPAFSTPTAVAGGAAGAVDAVIAAERPEIRMFKLEKERLEWRERLASVRNRPRVSSFGSAAYGRPPGLNMFKNELSPYYSVGIQVQWPLWDWGQARREREIAALQSEIVETQEEAFYEGVRAAAAQAREEIEMLRVTIERDREIIQLRNQIAARAAEQLDNGTISATDYLLEEEAARLASLELDRHRVELGLAEFKYLWILGYDDEIR